MGGAKNNDCFFITPIGEEGSRERRASDDVMNAIVAPAARRLGMVAIRADHIVDPGIITTQIVDKLIDCRMVVADLTGGNPNVFYELAVRHTFRKPAALIGRHGERLPFDAHGMRMIPYRPDDMSSVAHASETLEAHMRRGLEGAIDSPVATAVDVRARRQGSTERRVADIIHGLQRARRLRADRAPAGLPGRVIPSLRRLRDDLDEQVDRVPRLRASAALLRQTLEELEGYAEPEPPPPPLRPRDEFYEALEARARKEKWVDLDVLADLLKEDRDDPRK